LTENVSEGNIQVTD